MGRPVFALVLGAALAACGQTSTNAQDAGTVMVDGGPPVAQTLDGGVPLPDPSTLADETMVWFHRDPVFFTGRMDHRSCAPGAVTLGAETTDGGTIERLDLVENAGSTSSFPAVGSYPLGDADLAARATERASDADGGSTWIAGPGSGFLHVTAEDPATRLVLGHFEFAASTDGGSPDEGVVAGSFRFHCQ